MPTRIVMPEEGKNMLYFQNHHKQMKAPYIIYAELGHAVEKKGVELEMLTDYEMHFVERGIRRGISMVSKRYAKANNPYVEGYDPEEPNTFIQYLDANNLYGWAMCKLLPTRGFKWKRVMPTE